MFLFRNFTPVIIFSITIILCSFTNSEKDLYEFSVKRMDCEDSDPRIIEYHECKTEKLSRSLTALSCVLIPYSNLSFNQIYVKVDYLQRVGPVYRKTIISKEENFCGFLAGTHKSFLIKILWKALQKSGNLKSKCPYSGMLNVSRLEFDDEFLPPALPEGQARLDIHVRNGPQRISLIKVKLFVEVKPKGAAKLDFK